MPFHAVVVFTLGYDFLPKSILGRCETEIIENVSVCTLKEQNVSKTYSICIFFFGLILTLVACRVSGEVVAYIWGLLNL